MAAAGNALTREQNIANVFNQSGNTAVATPAMQKILDIAKQQTASASPVAANQTTPPMQGAIPQSVIKTPAPAFNTPVTAQSTQSQGVRLPGPNMPGMTPPMMANPPQQNTATPMYTGTPSMYHAGPSAAMPLPTNSGTPVPAFQSSNAPQGSFPGQMSPAQIQAEAANRIAKQKATGSLAAPQIQQGNQPTTNYGGSGSPLNELLYSKQQYDAGNTDWAANNATQYYNKLDPTLATQVHGMNTQQLTDYINSKNAPISASTQTPSALTTTPTNTGTPTPPVTSNWSTTPDQARQSAQEQSTARENSILAAGKNAWNTGLTGAKNAFDYTNQITNDNRTLRNAQFQETNNPFSGKFAYDKTNMLRNDNIQDTSTNADYNNKVGSINQTWQDLQSAAPEQQQALYDQLYQQAAQLGISADQLNLQLQKQTYDQSPNNPANIGQGLSNQLNQLKLNDYPAQSQAAAQQVQQQLQAGQITNQEAQYKLDQLKDPNSIANQQLKAQLDLTNSQSAYYKDHGQYYTSGGSQSGGSAASRTTANNSYTGTIYDNLSQLDPSDYQGYLEANQGEIVSNIGQKGYDDLKKSVLADQNATDKANTAQGKADTTTRSQAIASAQKDPDWKYATAEERKALIKQYEGYHAN